MYLLLSGGLPYAVFSASDAAIREQDSPGTAHAAAGLVRMELAADDTTAAA